MNSTLRKWMKQCRHDALKHYLLLKGLMSIVHTAIVKRTQRCSERVGELVSVSAIELVWSPNKSSVFEDFKKMKMLCGYYYYPIYTTELLPTVVIQNNQHYWEIIEWLQIFGCIWFYPNYPPCQKKLFRGRRTMFCCISMQNYVDISFKVWGNGFSIGERWEDNCMMYGHEEWHFNGWCWMGALKWDYFYHKTNESCALWNLCMARKLKYSNTTSLWGYIRQVGQGFEGLVMSIFASRCRSM